MTRLAYLFRVGRIPAVLNFGLNAAVGLLLFGGQAQVGWSGGGGLRVDLALGAFIVAFLTGFLTLPEIERDMRAGRVAGLPGDSAWRLLPGPRTARALVAAGLVAAGLALALPPLLAMGMPAGLSGGLAALFKGATCLLAGQGAIVLAGMRGLVGGPDHTAAHRAAVEAGRAVIGHAFDYIDKGALASTSIARGTSIAPTWHLVLEGDIPDDLLTRSVALLCDKYPSLRTRVVAVDGREDYAREYRYVDVGDRAILELPEEPLAVVRDEVLNRFIDLFREAPVTFTRVREEGGLHLLVHQHHAIADGRAFIGMLHAWAAIVGALETGGAPDLTPVGRRPENEAHGKPPAELRRLARRGFFRHFRETRARKRRPLEPLPWNLARDYSGKNQALHLVVDDAHLEAWRPLREARGVSMNSLITAAYLRAIHAFGAARGRTLDRLVCELAAETRPRDASFVSFANHLAAYLVTVAPGADLWATAQAVQAHVRAEASAQAHLERLLFQAWAVRLLPLDRLRALVLENPELRIHTNLSNLIPLPFPTIHGGSWRVRQVLITTPATPPVGVGLTMIRYGGHLTFNFNLKSSVNSIEDVRELAELFRMELASVGPEVAAEVIVSA